MGTIDSVKLIKALKDFERVKRQAYNEGYDLGWKKGFEFAEKKLSSSRRARASIFGS